MSTNRDKIRCFKCREYDHFAKDCKNISETEKGQSEQIQQMLNLEEDKTALKVCLGADTYENLIRANFFGCYHHIQERHGSIRFGVFTCKLNMMVNRVDVSRNLQVKTPNQMNPCLS